MNEAEIKVEPEFVVAGSSDYTELSNKPSINSVELNGDKTSADLGLQPAGNYLTQETDPIFSASASAGITNQDIMNWNNKSDFSGSYNDLTDKPVIPDVSDFITKDVNNLTYYTLATDTGSTIEMTINGDTYVMTLNLKNASGTTISTQNVDLPLETMVIGGSYDNINKKIILTLKNGNTIDVPVGDLINGLQTEITSTNKLDASLVDDSLSTNKFVTSVEKNTWNNKSNFSGDYNDLSNKPDLSKLSIIDNTGDGTQYLSNDGTYKPVSGGGEATMHYIDDTVGTSENPFVFENYEPGVYIFLNNTINNRTIRAKVLNSDTETSSFLIVRAYDIGYLTIFKKVDSSILTRESFAIVKQIRTNFRDYSPILTQQNALLQRYTNYSGGFALVGANNDSHTNVEIYIDTTNKAQTISAVKTFTVLPESSVVPTTNNQLTNKKYVDGLVTTYSGYDATKTQVLKNINGTLAWVDEA